MRSATGEGEGGDSDYEVLAGANLDAQVATRVPLAVLPIGARAVAGADDGGEGGDVVYVGGAKAAIALDLCYCL